MRCDVQLRREPAHLVQLLTRESGIRMALGASPGAVRWQVVRGGLLHAIGGAVAGSAAAAAAPGE